MQQLGFIVPVLLCKILPRVRFFVSRGEGKSGAPWNRNEVGYRFFYHELTGLLSHGLVRAFSAKNDRDKLKQNFQIQCKRPGVDVFEI